MITIYDSSGSPLKELWQYDVNQSVTVKGVELTGDPEFHFADCHTGTALVVMPTLLDDGFTAHIPNVLLSRAEPIKVYLYYETPSDGKHTKYVFEIPVKGRKKPDDYIFEDDTRYIKFTEIIAEAEELFDKFSESTFYSDDGYIKFIVPGRDPVDVVPLEDIKGERGERGERGEKGDQGERGDVNFATFHIDSDGHLIATYTEEMENLDFTLTDNKHLEVNING